MEGKNIENKLIETYEIRTKNPRAFIPRWKEDEIIDPVVNSLEDVSKCLSKYLPSSNWELKKEKVTKKGVIYIFMAIPHPDSLAARNPEKYPDQYIQVRIRPKIQLSD